MKRILTTVLACLLITFSFSQQIEETVIVESVSKTELYNRALRWFLENCNSSNNIIQLKDIENGEILGKIKYGFEIKTKGNSWGDWVSVADPYIITDVSTDMTIQILVKDNKYKYKITIDNIIKNKNGSHYAKLEETIAKIDSNINSKNQEYISAISIKIKEYMSKKSESKNDW